MSDDILRQNVERLLRDQRREPSPGFMGRLEGVIRAHPAAVPSDRAGGRSRWKRVLDLSPLAAILLVTAVGIAVLLHGKSPHGKEAAQDGNAQAAELGKLRGTWIAVSAEIGGERIAPERVREAEITFTIKGGEVLLKTSRFTEGIPGDIEVDPARTPKGLTLKFKPGDKEAGTVAGVYELADDTLKICYGPAGQEPVEFATKPGIDQRLYVFRRAATAGVPLRGKVVSHDGKPVAGAQVFLAGQQGLTLLDGAPEGFSGESTRTDSDGHFAFESMNDDRSERVVARSGMLTGWRPVPEEGNELTIGLPVPSTLSLRYHFEGGDREARLRVKLAQFQNRLNNADLVDIHVMETPRVENGTEVMLRNLAPGVYDVMRTKHLVIGGSGFEPYLDRRVVLLKAGEVAAVEFVRREGRCIEGELIGLKEAGVPGALIAVKSMRKVGDPPSPDGSVMTTYDAVASDASGRFKTGPIPPGNCTIVAQAWRPETEEERKRTGIRRPFLEARCDVEMPRGSPHQDPVRISLPMEAKQHPLTSKELSGTWRGEKDGMKVEVVFSGTADMSWQVIHGSREGIMSIGAELKRADQNPGLVHIRFCSAADPAGTVIGRFERGEAGTLKLTILPVATQFSGYRPVEGFTLSEVEIEKTQRK